MTAEDEKLLKAILEKDPSELSQNDKDVLRARWHYVGKNSRTKFADVLNEKSTNKRDKSDKKQEDTVKKEEENTMPPQGENTESIDEDDEIDE